MGVPKRNETINIISSSNESVQLDPTTDRQRQESIDVVGDNPLPDEDEEDTNLVQLAIELKARAEFKRILNAERFAKRRMKLILPERYSKRRFKSYKEDFKRQKERLSTNAALEDNNETIALDATVQEIFQQAEKEIFQQPENDVFTEIPGAIVDAAPIIEATPPATHVSDEPTPLSKSKDKGKGKGKGKSSSRIAKDLANNPPDTAIVLSEEKNVTEKKRNKSKKRKRSKVDMESNSSGYSDEDWERSSKRSKRKKKKTKRSKQQRSDSTEFLKKKQKSRSRLSRLSSDADAAGAEDNDGVEMEQPKKICS